MVRFNYKPTVPSRKFIPLPTALQIVSFKSWAYVQLGIDLDWRKYSDKNQFWTDFYTTAESFQEQTGNRWFV